MITEELIESLPEDPILSAQIICNQFVEEDEQIKRGMKRMEKYEYYIEVFGFFKALNDSYALGFHLPGMTDHEKENIKLIKDFFTNTKVYLEKEVTRLITERGLEKSFNKFSVVFKKSFAYELTDGDLKKIQTLINELREIIVKSDLFELNHKERLLRKLELLQKELHKRMSNLDKLWGLIGEAGVVLGKFGKDAKPFTDRIKEISNITWRIQSRSEELPSDSPIPLLGDKPDEN